MALVNQFGNPLRFAHAASRSQYRGPVYQRRNGSIDELIPEYDRETLVSLSRRLFVNQGVPRTAILQKADYSVGQAWMPRYQGADKDAGKQAETWLRESFLPNCDIRGGVHDWHTFLRLVSIGIDRDADHFTIITTEGDNPELPRIQHLPPHLVCTKKDEKIVSDGAYSGRPISNGIIYDGRGRPLAYRVSTGKQQDEYIEVPARAVIHLYDPTWQESGRGLPAFTHALEDLKHCLRSTEDERVRQQMLASIGLIEYNDIGGPDINDPQNYLANDSCEDDGLTITEFDNGKIKYFSSNSGGKIEQIEHKNPGPVWESFHDRLIRAAVAGVNWSYSLAWKPTGQGTAERAELEKARRAVNQRQSLMWHFAIRTITYAVSKAVKAGIIPPLESPMAWNFSMPPKLTVDDGRELKSMIEAWKSGAINMTEIIESRGDTSDEHFMERADEIARRELARRAKEEEYGVSIDPREMAMLTPNEQPSQTNEDELN